MKQKLSKYHTSVIQFEIRHHEKRETQVMDQYFQNLAPLEKYLIQRAIQNAKEHQELNEIKHELDIYHRALEKIHPSRNLAYTLKKMNNNVLDTILDIYGCHDFSISKALVDIHKKNDKKLFAELRLCILQLQNSIEHETEEYVL